MSVLEVKDLHVSVDGDNILSGVDFTFNSGEIHAIMGPNGNGKSTLLQTIMGNPKYEITSGDILLDGKSIIGMSADERSKQGLFLGMQHPMEIHGITNFDFLHACVKAHGRDESVVEFSKNVQSTIDRLKMSPTMTHRYLNDGFSGGEKKRNEILQMIMLNPKFAMLDEIDSGLDVDAMKIVAEVINETLKERQIGLIVVSHYQRFYEYIMPNFVHVVVGGKVVETGDVELSRKIDKHGYHYSTETA